MVRAAQIALMRHPYRRRADVVASRRPSYGVAAAGWVAERFKAPVLKTGVRASAPWVRIPPHPPFLPKRYSKRTPSCGLRSLLLLSLSSGSGLGGMTAAESPPSKRSPGQDTQFRRPCPNLYIGQSLYEFIARNPDVRSVYESPSLRILEKTIGYDHCDIGLRMEGEASSGNMSPCPSGTSWATPPTRYASEN